jgi:hypothetical protein
MNTILLGVLLVLTYLASAGTLVYSPYPVYEVKYGSAATVAVVEWNPSACGYEVDLHLRTTYYSFLSNSQLVYMTNIRDSYGFLYIHQYRNYVGTFYAISRYGTPSKKVSVVYFCRLGAGYDLQHTYFEPFYIQPYTISLDLGYGIYWTPKWADNDQPQWNWTWARSKWYKTPVLAEEASGRCEKWDAYVRTTYWYYLKDASRASAENSVFGQQCYCTHTYVNLLGTWQVIGYEGPSGNTISTFVRLGDGCNPSGQVKLKPYPAFSTWHFA